MVIEEAKKEGKKEIMRITKSCVIWNLCGPLMSVSLPTERLPFPLNEISLYNSTNAEYLLYIYLILS